MGLENTPGTEHSVAEQRIHSIESQVVAIWTRVDETLKLVQAEQVNNAKTASSYRETLINIQNNISSMKTDFYRVLTDLKLDIERLRTARSADSSSALDWTKLGLMCISCAAFIFWLSTQ